MSRNPDLMPPAGRERSKSGGIFRLRRGREEKEAVVILQRVREALKKPYDAEDYQAEQVISDIQQLKHYKQGLKPKDSFKDNLIVLAIKQGHLDALKAMFSGHQESWPSVHTQRSMRMMDEAEPTLQKKYPVIIALFEVALRYLADVPASDDRDRQLSVIRDMANFLLDSKYPLRQTMFEGCLQFNAGESYIAAILQGLMPRSLIDNDINSETVSALHPFSLQRIFFNQDGAALLTLMALLGPAVEYLHQHLSCRPFKFSPEGDLVKGKGVTDHGTVTGTWFDYLYHVVVNQKFEHINYEFLATLMQVGYSWQHSDYSQLRCIIPTASTARRSGDSIHDALGVAKAQLLHIALMDGALRGHRHKVLVDFVDTAQRERFLMTLCARIWEYRRLDGEIHQPLLNLMRYLLNKIDRADEIKDVIDRIKGKGTAESDRLYLDELADVSEQQAVSLARVLTVIRRTQSQRTKTTDVSTSHEELDVEGALGDEASIAADRSSDDGECSGEAPAYAEVRRGAGPPAMSPEAVYASMEVNIASLGLADQIKYIQAALANHAMERLVTWMAQGYEFVGKPMTLLSEHFVHHVDDFDSLISKLEEQASMNAAISKALTQFKAEAGYEDMRPTTQAAMGVPAASAAVGGIVNGAEDNIYENPDADSRRFVAGIGQYGEAASAGLYGLPTAASGNSSDDEDRMAGAAEPPRQPAQIYGEAGQQVRIDGQGGQIVEAAYANGPDAMKYGVLGPALPVGTHRSRPQPLPRRGDVVGAADLGSAAASGLMAPRPRPRPRRRPRPQAGEVDHNNGASSGPEFS